MLRHAQSFFRNEDGNIAITLAVIALPLIGFGGLAVDYSDAILKRQAYSIAADSAALAVAVASEGDLAKNGDGLKQIGEDAFRANVGWPFDGDVQVDLDPELSQVTVSATTTKDVYFPFYGKTWEIGVRSVAQALSTMPWCVIALATSGDAISIGGSASFDAPGCAVHANSSLKKWGAASASAGQFCTTSHSAPGAFSPLKTDCAQMADPFLPKLVFPDPTAVCTPSNSSYGGGYATIQPGLFCNGIELKGTAKVTLSPGVYVIRDAELKVGANARLTGTDVVIVLQGSARFSFAAGSEVSLSAPQDGAFEGVVIAQDGGTASSGGESNIGGGGNVELSGSVYLPKQTLSITGGGNLNMISPQTAIVAERFKFTGNASATLHMRMGADFSAAGYSGSPVNGLSNVRLVE